MSMSKEYRDKILKEDLGWLDTMTVHQIDGKLMLGGETGELPFNVSHVMEEDEFVRKYLVGFAVGYLNRKNYFDREAWNKLTFNGTRAVMVVKKNEETGQFKPVLLVPPLITHALTEEDFLKLRIAAVTIHTNHHDTMKTNNINASLDIATKLADERIGLKAKPTTLADLISPSYFESKKIIPAVEQSIYWIRDVIRQGQKTEPADLDKARGILFRDHKGEKVSKEEYEFIAELSRGEYKLEEKLKEASDAGRLGYGGTDPSGAKPSEPPKEQPKPSDNPLEC